MKLPSFSLAITVLLAFSATTFAADKTTDTSKQKKPVKMQKAKTASAKSAKPHDPVTVTGSYIKRDVQRNGFVSTGPNIVYVLDNDTIANSGAATVRELLIRRGANR